MHKLNPRTAALLSAFGWAVGYLLAGKALAVLLPAAPGGAARFFRVCLLYLVREENPQYPVGHDRQNHCLYDLPEAR